MSANLASKKEIEALLRNIAAVFDSGEELTPEETQYFSDLCDRTADAIAEQRGTSNAGQDRESYTDTQDRESYSA